jgi:hypothetical protein
MSNTTYRTGEAVMRGMNRLLLGGAAVVIATAVSGCGGASTAAGTTPLPTPPATTKFNTYVGTQGAQASPGVDTGDTIQGGLVTATLDDTADKFTLVNSTFGSAASALVGTLGGTFLSSGAFLDLTTTNPGASQPPPVNLNPGYAIEIPGRALLLRPGDYTVAPALLLPVSTSAIPVCQTINTYTTFQFVTLPDVYNSIVPTPVFGATNGGPAYGALTAAAKNGVNYSIINYNRFYFDGTSTSPAGLQPGLCAQTLAGAAVTIPPDVKNNVPATTIEIGPSGIFLMDQTQQKNPNASGAQNGPSASVGVAQPSSPLSVSSIIAAQYAGFRFEPALEANNDPFNNSGCPLTELVGFGATAGTGSSLVGGTLGAYPAYACATYPIPGLTEDPTATQLSDTTITLGTQSSNGLFSNGSVTEPDPNGVCAANGVGTVGVDAHGKTTCTFPAVIVAGNPEGKFVLFLIANDLVNSSPLGIYLFQQ